MPEQTTLHQRAEPCAPPTQKRTLELFFFDAGGGHRSAANALIESIGTSFPEWDIKLINLQKMLEPSDPIYQLTGLQSEDVYNAAIRRGWTYGSRPFLRTLQKAIALNANPMKRVLIKHWQHSNPDMVVSVVPNFNRIMFDALQMVHPDKPYVTIMTDVADSPPHFWMEDQDQYMICGSRKALIQAHLSGFYRPERIFQTSGMILRPSFYNQPTSTEFTRESIGLEAGKPTAIIMFGGNGSKVSAKIAERLHAEGVQSIVMCGRDVDLLKSLQGKPGCHAVGFTDKVADYMRLADVFVGKPGPGSMSEALKMGLPVIVEGNAKTMIQERYNIIWAEEQGLGVSIPSFADIGKATRYLLASDRFAAYRERALKLENKAVFEIPDMLSQIFTAHKGTHVPPRPSALRRASTRWFSHNDKR